MSKEFGPDAHPKIEIIKGFDEFAPLAVSRNTFPIIGGYFGRPPDFSNENKHFLQENTLPFLQDALEGKNNPTNVDQLAASEFTSLVFSRIGNVEELKDKDPNVFLMMMLKRINLDPPQTLNEYKYRVHELIYGVEGMVEEADPELLIKGHTPFIRLYAFFSEADNLGKGSQTTFLNNLLRGVDLSGI